MNMKNRLTQGILLCALLFGGCDDIFEKDITKSFTEIIAPVANATVSGPEVLFWWNYVDGSDYYELQIVEPDFPSVEYLLADTIVEENKITFAIAPGTYECRIRACNSAYCTKYSYRSFTLSGN
jgi:hypothetical protein